MDLKLQLGCGAKPEAGYIHHDLWVHSPHIDIAHDLEKLPWPWWDESVEKILAIDVFEHLRLDVREWLDECWRILIPYGVLEMRLAAWDNPYSYRDPTHRRVFHPESFLYWCPSAPGTVWQNFGRYYFGPDHHRWWKQLAVKVEARDLRFTLEKIVPD